MSSNTFFEIVFIGYDYHEENERGEKRPDYEIGSVYNMFRIFTTEPISKMSELIKENMKKNEIDEDYVHHIIVTDLKYDKLKYMSIFITRHIFLPDGTKWVSLEYDASDFKGRNPEDCNFKEGDKVEFVNYDKTIYSGVVLTQPITPEYLARTNTTADETDDSYIVLAGLDEIPSELTEDEYFDRHYHVTSDSIFRRRV